MRPVPDGESLERGLLQPLRRGAGRQPDGERTRGVGLGARNRGDVTGATPLDPSGALRSDECAGWWQRLGGALLDGLLQLVSYGLLAVVVLGLWWVVDSEGFDRFFEATEYDAPGFDEIDAMITAALLSYLGFVALWEVLWLRSSAMGKPGQRAAGFRVVVADEVTRMGTGRAIARYAAKTAMSLVLGGLAAIASAFTIGLSSKKQSLHDMVAGTACVRTYALRRRGVLPDGMLLPPPTPGSLPPPTVRSTADEPRGSGPFM